MRATRRREASAGHGFLVPGGTSVFRCARPGHWLLPHLEPPPTLPSWPCLRCPAPPVSVRPRGAQAPFSSLLRTLFHLLKPGSLSGYIQVCVWAGRAGTSVSPLRNPQLCELGLHTCVYTPYYANSYQAAPQKHRGPHTEMGTYPQAPVRVLGASARLLWWSPGTCTFLKHLGTPGAGCSSTGACESLCWEHCSSQLTPRSSDCSDPGRAVPGARGSKTRQLPVDCGSSAWGLAQGVARQAGGTCVPEGGLI